MICISGHHCVPVIVSVTTSVPGWISPDVTSVALPFDAPITTETGVSLPFFRAQTLFSYLPADEPSRC